MKGKMSIREESKQVIRFSLIKLLLIKRTDKQLIPESNLSKKLNIIQK